MTSEQGHTARKSDICFDAGFSIANQPQVAVTELRSHRMPGLLSPIPVEQAFSAGITSF